jgi:hypothetical protein
MTPSDPRGVDLPGPFRFESADVVGDEVRLAYAIGDAVRFVEVVRFPFPVVESPEIGAAVHLLHLVAGVSYYKCVAPRPLETPALTADQRELVAALYDEGLREFAYTNGIPLPLPVEIAEATGSAAHLPGRPSDLTGALIPVGGGTDPALVADLVPDGVLMAVNPVGAHRRLAEHLDRPLLAVERHLDPGLRDLVDRGAPNGHVPVTAINSAVAVVTALSLGLRDVLIGLERSASEPTVVVDGVEINHQFSKSRRTESLIARAVAPTGVRYVSILRPLTELAIGTAVARRGLADGIVSCNRVFTIWNDNEAARQQGPCGDCAKCLFTSLMLAPSLDPARIREHFGRDLLDEVDHIEPVRQLWSDDKPFDCVGERLESAAALALLADLPSWREQRVVVALADEARSLLASEAVDPAEFLAVDPLDGLPSDYRARIEELAQQIHDAAGSTDAA